MRITSTFLSSALLATAAATALAQTGVPLPGNMPKPNIAAQPKESATPNVASPAKEPATPSTPAPAGTAHNQAMPSMPNATTPAKEPAMPNGAAPAGTTHNPVIPNAGTLNNGASNITENKTANTPSTMTTPQTTQQNQASPPAGMNRSAQQNQAQQTLGAQQQSQGTAHTQQGANRSGISQNSQTDANLRQNERTSNDNRTVNNRERDQRSDQASDRSSARQHTVLRPNDLRGPDIGLWFDHSARDGLVISDIATRGAIANLGFREGDRLVSVNGRRVAREADFTNFLFGGALGVDGVAADSGVAVAPVDVVVSRDGQEQTIQVDPSLLLADYGYETPQDPIEQFGVVLDDRYNDRVVVWKVLPRSPAYYAGLRSGDVLTGFHDQPLSTREAFEKSIAAAEPGETGVQIRRGDRSRDLQVDIPRTEERAESRTALRPNLNAGNSGQRSDEKRSESQENRSDSDNSSHPDPFRANH